MEREVMLTGIGGQGVQLAAQVLARAAAREGRHVMMFGSYGGTMRGGPTASTVVVADRPVVSPPVVARSWGAIALHASHWEPVRAKLRAGAVVAVSAPLFTGAIDRARHVVLEIPATRIAEDVGSPQAAALVMTGAFAGATDLVGLEALVAGLHEALPARRRAQGPVNEAALRAGFGAAPRGSCPAWANGEAG